MDIALLLVATTLLPGCQFQKELDRGLAHPARWLTYSGDYSGRRHSPLTQITPGNVAQLRPEWTFKTGERGPLEATPLVYDGTLYFSGHSNTVWAIDGRTGREIWRYDRKLPDGLRLCCNASNRGLAMHRNRLFMATLDAHLVALALTCPDDLGATNFMSPSFDPVRGLFFVTARETCGRFLRNPGAT